MFACRWVQGLNRIGPLQLLKSVFKKRNFARYLATVFRWRLNQIWFFVITKHFQRLVDANMRTRGYAAILKIKVIMVNFIPEFLFLTDFSFRNIQDTDFGRFVFLFESLYRIKHIWLGLRRNRSIVNVVFRVKDILRRRFRSLVDTF